MIAITTRFLGPTNTKGARVVAECDGARIVREYDYAAGNKSFGIVACELARKQGWTGTFLEGYAKGGRVFVFATSPQKWDIASGKELN